MAIIAKRHQMRKQHSNSAGYKAYHEVAERQTQMDLVSVDSGLM